MNDEEPLTILAVNKRSWAHSRSGGAEVNLEETLKRLQRKGHTVHLLVGSDGDRAAMETEDGVRIRRVGFDHLFPDPVDVIVSYVLVAVYFHWYIHRVSPDVVYTVYDPLPWPIMTLRPRVTIFHHIAIESFMQTHPFPQNVIGSFAQRLGVYRERGNITVSVSPSTTADLRSRGHAAELIYEVRNGLAIENYPVGAESESPRMVYLGALDTYKGADRLPEIHRAVQRMAEFDVELHIAGAEGPVSERIDQYCGESDNCCYHGYVSEREKLRLLQSAWVLVVPSRIEGWGIAVIEANACETPAVGSRVRGLRDSIQHEKTGLLSEAGEPEVFASDVLRLLTDENERREFGRNARAWAEKHSWESSTDDLERVFYRAVSKTA